MNIKKEILEFMSKRPETIGIIGYGSGVNPQKGQEKRKPQIDLIAIVDNLKNWHKQNIKQNPQDYSITSKAFFNYGSNKKLKSGAHICYMTYIPYKNQEYKIGTIEINDFLNDLNNWETFYLAGRMQKPILIVKATKEIEKAIEENRKKGATVAKILLENTKYDEKEFYIKLTSLSYIGDTRMKIAENPDKVKNIVEGSLEFYQKTYKKYLNEENNIKILPTTLQNRLNNPDKNNQIIEFLTQKNRSQSTAQTVKGIFTTGPVKAIKYAKAKLKRKKKR